MKKRCMLSVYQKSEKKHRCFRVCTSHRLGIEFTCLRHDIGTAGGSGAARGCGRGGGVNHAVSGVSIASTDKSRHLFLAVRAQFMTRFELIRIESNCGYYSLLPDHSITRLLGHSITRSLEHLVTRFRRENISLYYHLDREVSATTRCQNQRIRTRTRRRSRSRTAAARLQRHRGEHALNTLIFFWH